VHALELRPKNVLIALLFAAIIFVIAQRTIASDETNDANSEATSHHEERGVPTHGLPGKVDIKPAKVIRMTYGTVVTPKDVGCDGYDRNLFPGLNRKKDGHDVEDQITIQ
jgi:hypothetical protein